MSEADFKSGIVLMAMMGLAIFVFCIVMYILAARVSSLGYLLLPLPPLAAASYIYLNNWLKHNDLFSLKGPALVAKLWEVSLQTVIGGLTFLVITFLMLLGLLLWHTLKSGSG